jgi:hypothetical protein
MLGFIKKYFGQSEFHLGGTTNVQSPAYDPIYEFLPKWEKKFKTPTTLFKERYNMKMDKWYIAETHVYLLIRFEKHHNEWGPEFEETRVIRAYKYKAQADEARDKANAQAKPLKSPYHYSSITVKIQK